ncbi:hypothetical protein V1503_13120 [Bacillus sp. SCS-151]|uniref:hypothetical protein n=1 Tax=Nanhaiella sioensis TaxID=3115293 RepID=UPI00397E4825
MTSIIPFKEAYKHLGGEYKYPTQSSRSSLISRITRLIKYGVVQGDENDKLVDINSLKDYVEFESNILEEYMNLVEFHELLGTSVEIRSDKMKDILSGLRTEFIFDYVETEFPIYNRKFFINKSSVERFLRAYISVDEVKSVVSRSENTWWYTFKRLEITPLTIGAKRFIKKSEYENILDEADASINQSNYYTLEEFRQVLLLSQTKDSLAVEKDYDLKPLKLNGHWKFYKKDIIDDLKLRQNYLREKYISLPEAEELAAAEGFRFGAEYIESEPVNSLLRPFFKNKVKMYSIEVFNNWLEGRKTKSEFFSLSMESDFNTFKYRSEIKGIDINELGPFTSKTWLQFISSNLKSSKANSQSTDRYITNYVYCTEYLIGLVNSTKIREIYSVTSNDINILFNEIPKRSSLIIYRYLKGVYNQLNKEKMKAFAFQKVNDPNDFDKEEKDKSVYEYEVYKEVYRYAKNLSLHKERAIRDTLREISGKRKIKYYATSWLYVLLHLNNAWRHSDIITFPKVNLSGTQIIDLNWILKNDLEDDDVDHIIKQVYRSEFIISKTQVKNYFFCSEELKKTFATAIAICQFRINALSPLRESLIDFGNKKQNFSDSRRKSFFGLYDDKEFHFSSRKMNRSLLSYIYVLLSKMQKGSEGLKTIQKMRGHLEKETTNMYVDIPKEELNFLTKQLFARGSFGFIYDTFLDVLQGVEIDREKRTTEIQFLEKYIGSIHQIEEISGFLNVIQRDRKAILDRILAMGLDEALEFINKIETNQLPSKKENVQCMVAETGCVKKGQGVDCFDCAYNIPNYYSLSALGASLQDRLNNYLDSHKLDSEIPYYEQRKRARLFYIQLDMFAQAIQKFGFDVYEFLTDSREEFIEKQDMIRSLADQFQLTEG